MKEKMLRERNGLLKDINSLRTNLYIQQNSKQNTQIKNANEEAYFIFNMFY